MNTDQSRADQAADQATATLQESFAFVMNVWHLREADNYALAPGLQLRRATADEIAVIREIITKLATPPMIDPLIFWERKLPYHGSIYERLPEPEWRYYVIALKEGSLGEFDAVFDIAPVEVEIGFTVRYTTDRGRCAIHNPGRLFHVLDDASHRESFFVDISAADIELYTALNAQLQQHDHLLVDVKRLLIQLSQLKGLPHTSPLRFLGYFAILESLLTHAPKPLDPYESITRQVKKKVALLDHRWQRTIDYSSFGGAPPETIWTKMYDYRSLLAHGGVPEFTGNLTMLRSHQGALKLIKETVKAVIRQALAEPQLLIDLREC